MTILFKKQKYRHNKCVQTYGSKNSEYKYSWTVIRTGCMWYVVVLVTVVVDQV